MMMLEFFVAGGFVAAALQNRIHRSGPETLRLMASDDVDDDGGEFFYLGGSG